MECFCDGSCFYFGIKCLRSGGVLSFPDALSSWMFFFSLLKHICVCVRVREDWQSNLVFNIQSKKSNHTKNNPIFTRQAFFTSYFPFLDATFLGTVCLFTEHNFRKLLIVWLFLSELLSPSEIVSILSISLSSTCQFTFVSNFPRNYIHISSHLLSLNLVFFPFCFSDYACPFSCYITFLTVYVKFVKVRAVKKTLAQEAESEIVSFYSKNSSLPTFPTLQQLEIWMC